MLITVGRYLDVFEAHILCGRLNYEGIPACVSGGQHMQADWPLSLALGGARVQVPAAFLEQAREVLARYESGELLREVQADDEVPGRRCPRCDSAQVLPRLPLSQQLLVLTTALLASSPFPTRINGYRCRGCRHQWAHDAA